jgi:type I restriction enzyme S subunit
MPSLSKQRAIVGELDKSTDATRDLLSLYSAKIGLIEDLKQSILQKAFSGALTSLPSHVINEAAE